MFGCASFWTCNFVGVIACLIPRFFYDFVQKIYWPKDIDTIREFQLPVDFDAYPENYNPTDSRVTITYYSSDEM